jgi:acetyltransferase-like isoleucine patch superfamily enzyme
MIAGDAVIGDFTQMGMNATINIGVKVGRMCLIGNGATIKNNVPDGTRVHAGTVWPPFHPDKFNKTREV